MRDIDDIVGQCFRDGKLMHKVYNGDHHGHAVYRYVPVEQPTTIKDREDARRALKALNEYRERGGYSLDEIKAELGLE